MSDITEKELEQIERRLNEYTEEIKESINTTQLLPLTNYAESVTMGVPKAIKWSFKLGVKHERTRILSKIDEVLKNGRDNARND